MATAPRKREIARKAQRSSQTEALEAIIHRGELDPSCASAAQSLQHLNLSLDVDFDDGIRLLKSWIRDARVADAAIEKLQGQALVGHDKDVRRGDVVINNLPPVNC